MSHPEATDQEGDRIVKALKNIVHDFVEEAKRIAPDHSDDYYNKIKSMCVDYTKKVGRIAPGVADDRTNEIKSCITGAGEVVRSAVS